MKAGLIVTGVAAAAAALLAGCGKPENSAYTSKPQDEAQTAALKTPLPAAPSWAASVIGRQVSSIAKGQATCRGAVDVTMKHGSGGRVGDEIQGWAWDMKGKQPPVRILLADPGAKVIGAGDVNRDRPDVPKAVTEVKTSKVGYTLVTRATAGVASVLGVTSTGALCTIGAAQLL